MAALRRAATLAMQSAARGCRAFASRAGQDAGFFPVPNSSLAVLVARRDFDLAATSGAPCWSPGRRMMGPPNQVGWAIPLPMPASRRPGPGPLCLTSTSPLLRAAMSAPQYWVSPLAAAVMESPANLSPLCAVQAETIAAFSEEEGAGPAMYADSVRRKRKHKMNKHKHRCGAPAGWGRRPPGTGGALDPQRRSKREPGRRVLKGLPPCA